MDQPSMVVRLKSLVVDLITIFIITLILGISPSFQAKIIASFVPFVYFPILHIFWSRSIGDIVFKLKVVDQQGNKIGFWPALDRFFGVFAKWYIISLFFNNLLFMVSILVSGTLKDISEDPLDYERESKTYLVNAR